MANTTPDFEEDAIRRAATLVGAAITLATNAWSGPERPSGRASGDVVPLEATFVMSTSTVDDLHNDGPHRFFGVQFLVRDNDYSGGWSKARNLYDKIHLSGSFTGNSGAVYQDVRAETPYHREKGPNDKAFYFIVNAELWFDGWLVV